MAKLSKGPLEPHGSEGRAIVGEHDMIAGFIGVAPKGAVEGMRKTLADIAEGAVFDEPAKAIE